MSLQTHPTRKRKEIFFATSNEHKVKEFEKVLKDVCTLRSLKMHFIEIQSKSFEGVVINKLSQLVARFPHKNLLVEDSGVIIDTLSSKMDFPGVYSHDFYYALGLEKILSLLQHEKNRRAKMVSYIGYYDAEKREIKIFKGEIEGTLATTRRGEAGFGFDPIFIPLNHSKTFGEDYDLKNKVSHRYKALQQLKEYLKKNA